MSTEPPFSLDPQGVRLAVRLTPRAKRTALDGVIIGSDGRPALGLRVAAPPVEGAANKALIAFVAAALQLRKADVTILSGETARLKMLHLCGDGGLIAARLRDWIGS